MDFISGTVDEVCPRWSPCGVTRRRLACVLLAAVMACAAPIGVERIGSEKAQRELTGSILSLGRLSEKARILLRRTNHEEAWQRDPEAVLEDLHARLSVPADPFNVQLRAWALDGVAELAFAHASESGDRRYFLSAALYAWLYLFPPDPENRPDALDRGARICADIYNRSLTLAFTHPESREVVLEDGQHELPFGTLFVDFDESSLRWGGNRALERFAPLADLRVRGLNNRYRTSGLGAPLAAQISESSDPGETDLIFAKVRVPVSALLRFVNSEADLTGDRFHADLSVIAYSDTDEVIVDRQSVPLEVEPTAALALQLSEAPPWQRELRGFFRGDLARDRPGLMSLVPYRRGRIPLVLVHGTASSAGRWADLVNDLESDPILRRHYQIWLFTYDTGNPIPYSGWLLRSAIADLVETLDPEGTDPALRQMVVMGHSQGGLLTKLQVVDSGEDLWKLVIEESPSEVDLAPANREILEGSLLVEPSPFVKRVIFLSTPHRGSRLAALGAARLVGRFVRMPANLVTAVGEIVTSDTEAEVQRRLRRGAGAIGNMSPSSRFIQTLAALPIASGVRAHSIIGVKKEPRETGGDGVVSYESAHLDGVDSELVVTSGHSSQSNPVVVGETRRILIAHLAEAIEAGIVAREGLPQERRGDPRAPVRDVRPDPDRGSGRAREAVR